MPLVGAGVAPAVAAAGVAPKENPPAGVGATAAVGAVPGVVDAPNENPLPPNVGADAVAAGAAGVVPKI